MQRMILCNHMQNIYFLFELTTEQYAHSSINLSSCYLRKRWFLKRLDTTAIFTGCTPKMKGQPNPQKLPDGANHLQAEKSDWCIRWQLEMYQMMARDGH